MKTADLIGPALAWAVGTAEDCKMETWHTKSVAILFPGAPRAVPWNPHANWAQGGPIIEREGIDLYCNVATKPEHPDPAWRGSWRACYHSMGRRSEMFYGETALIAAMRCYVASKLGDEIEIPEELK